MSSIDERVVSMKFDNKQFEAGIKTTLSSLDALNKGLKLEGATKGLSDVDAAAKKVSLSTISDGLDKISSKFSAVNALAIGVLVGIGNKALDLGTKLVGSLSFDNITAGLGIYETKLNSIQTILANTQGDHTGLGDVTKALQQLNDYSNQTIYNFGEMAKNIGTFTAAGLKLDASVSAIKGIANLAAISGSSSEQASTAMYQLSQALASGVVHLMDWNSVVNAGMGGKVFQDALIETARIHHVKIDQMIKDQGSFRNTLQSGWLTSNILAETLSHFAGDLNDKQLKAQGYTAAQIQQLHVLAQTATEAATKVKTFPQLMDVLKETVATGWAQSFEIMFGNINEAKDLFTNINNVIGGFISKSAEARNKVLGDWKELGGRTAILQSIANVFHFLVQVITPIKDAFREIFPPITGKQLADLSKAIEKFTEKLKIGGETSKEIKKTFAGFFAILGIGKDLIVDFLKFIGKLFGEIPSGSGNILKFTARLGDMVVHFKTALETGQKLERFFGRVEEFLKKPIAAIKEFGDTIGHAFGKIGDAADPALQRIEARFAPLGKTGEVIAGIWDKIAKAFTAVKEVATPIIKAIGDFFQSLGKKIQEGLKNVGFDSTIDAVNTGLLAGLLIVFKKFLDKITGFKFDKKGGFLDTIKESFDNLTGVLKSMQLQLKAKALIEIAAAIGLLTISVVALSLINSNNLTAAVAAMTVMFTNLLGSMAIFEKIAGSKGFAKMPVIAASMILLGIAVDVLVIAVKNMSELNWDQLARGLTGLTIVLGELVATVEFMPKEKLIGAGVGLILLATAVKILASAMDDFAKLSWADLAKGGAAIGAILISLELVSKFMESHKGGLTQDLQFLLLAASIKVLALAVQSFAGLSWGQIAKGLVSMAGALAIIVTALSLVPPDAIFGAAAILVVSLSFKQIASALEEMGKMSWGEIGKGLTAMLGALTLIAVAVSIIPPTAIIGAASILVVALALQPIAKVLDEMGKMSWGAIGKAMTVLAGALLIIAVGVTAMEAAIPGAAALVIVAGALAVIAPVLQTLGGLSWENIGKGLLTIAGIFVILGAAGIVLGPLVPVIIGLAGGVALLGLGMAAAGAGVLAFSLGLAALATIGSAGAAAITAIVTSLLGLLPLVAKEIGIAVIVFAQTIAAAAPAIVDAIVTVLTALMDGIIKLTPKIVQTLGVLLDALIKLLEDYVPKLVDMGYKLLIGILTGIGNNIRKVVDKATDVVVNFIKGVSDSIPKIIQAGFDLLINFMNGIGNAARNNGKALGDAGANMATGIIQGLVSGLAGGTGKIVKAAENAAKAAWDAAMKWLGINSPSKKFIEIGKSVNEGFAMGLDKYSDLTAVSAKGVASTALDKVKDSISGLSDLVAGTDAMNLTPTITPVLDLSKIQKDAGSIGRVLGGTVPISVRTSTSQAVGTSDAIRAENSQGSSTSRSPGDTNLTFNQYNNSPAALDEATIYRQTKNQLSVAKGVVTSVNPS